MDDDFEAAASIASMATPVAATEGRGKARASCKAGAPPKMKKELTSEEGAVESAKRKGRRHAQDPRGEAAAAAAQQEDTNAWVKDATMVALLYLGVNPSQHRLVNTIVDAAAANTGSSTYPRMMLQESPHASCTQPIPGFHVYLQGSCFFEECSPEVSIVAPSRPAPATIDLNAAPVEDVSSSEGMRKSQREMRADMLTDAHNPFDEMPAAVDDDTVNRFLENMIFEGVSSFGGIQEAVQDHGDSEKARPRGKTNSKKEDRRDAASIAFLEKVEGMISKKDLREEKRRQEKEEQMHAFMEIQRRRLEMDAERQAKILELEEAKQAKMLEIEATNARTKAKEVAIASMKTGGKIMKVDLNIVSPRKRLWSGKMQAEMLKFDQL
ncbi:C2 domain-containing protein [Hordeum vulgare]|nr:C2 domain-containing protein [Hordeum vulgare]